MTAFDPEESATLYWKYEGDDRYVVARGPLRTLPLFATQGHNGDVEDMIILTETGHRFMGGEIRGVPALTRASEGVATSPKRNGGE